MPNPLNDPSIQAHLERFQQQQQAQQMLHQMLQASLERPHSMTRYSQFAWGVIDVDQGKALMFGIPGGIRIEVVIPTLEMARDIARALEASGDET